MPFVDPPVPFAVPPRVADVDPGDDWDGELDIEDGYALLRDMRIEGSLDLAGCRELELIDCTVEGASFAEAPGIQIELVRCALTTCDLSGATLKTLTKSSLTGCKLIGTDLAGMAVEDTHFNGGILRYTNLRMASYLRVGFDNLTLDEADFYDSALDHVTFEGSELTKVVFDKCRMNKVDLRGATQLGITAATGMEGALISDEQVVELAYLFALASGVGIERSSPD